MFPANVAIGSAKDLINYYANGEAADWALAQTGIIAMSPELGSASTMSMTFDVPSVREEAQIILENMDMPFYLMRKATAQLQILALSPSQSAFITASGLKLQMTILNKGMLEAKDVKVTAKLNDGTKVASISVSLDSTLPARSSQKIQVVAKDLSEETLAVIRGATTP